MSDVLERVRKIVIEHLDADPEKVTEKAAFIDDLGADSLDNVELVAVSTDKDGPGIAGTWQIAFDTGSQSAGPHNIDVRAYSTQRGPSFGATFTSYQLGQ